MARATSKPVGTDSPARTRPSPRKRMPSDQRRAQILRAARTVVVERGLDGARTRDIAAEAGINEAMLYRHFASKDALFEAAVSAPLQAAVQTLLETSGEPPAEFDATGVDTRARTRDFLVDLINVMDEVADMLGVALFRQTDVASDYYKSSIAPTLEMIQDVVRANFESWRHADFDTGLVVNFVFGAAWFHATAAKLEGRPVDAEATADGLVGLVFDGLFRDQEASRGMPHHPLAGPPEGPR